MSKATAMAMKAPDTDSNGLPYGSTRVGNCGSCGGHVVVSNNSGVQAPPKCVGCGAEMNTKKGLPMKPAAGKGGKKGWLPKKRTVPDTDSDGY